MATSKQCSNVLVSEEGVPLLADFGNAILHQYTLKFTNTSPKSAISIRWAAPELMNDTEGTYTAEADVYALGMTILVRVHTLKMAQGDEIPVQETITGKVPWKESPDVAIMMSVVVKKEHPKRPESQIPYNTYGNQMWSLLTWSWAYQPEDRPRAEQVTNELWAITLDQ
ncbi:Tyrosine-protein kinase SPK-1 [Ceratobasidium sp. AG-Ba]|nr:Tyrosine-protein kinase SPK-1 [Ceratobasidium sp. AG-Ba]